MDFVIKTAIGNLKITCEGSHIVKIEMTYENENKTLNKIQIEIKNKFADYFHGQGLLDDLPIKIKATAFREKVYRELIKVPYGQTVTYKDLAMKINNPKAARAVGSAMKNNPLPFVIPCHRVVGTNNPLAYAYGADLKFFLLNMEKANAHKFNL